VTTDVFVSHASEDKDAAARPLADELGRRGLTVWYDEYSLRVGDSLMEKVNQGLSGARFGVVIISPDFIAKRWTQLELDGLIALDQGPRRGSILPVWHNVTEEQVRRWNPTLAGRLATSTSKGIPAVADDLIAAIEDHALPRLPNAVLAREGAQQLPMTSDQTVALVERATSSLPTPSGMGLGAGTLVLAVSAGPTSTILRPAELRDPAVEDDLNRLALTGEVSVLNLKNGTQVQRTGTSITLRQDHAFVQVDNQGTITVGGPAQEPRQGGFGSTLSALIEEDIRARLERAIRFVVGVLDRFDPEGRLTQVALVGGLVGVGVAGWRTRAEHAANPTQMTIPTGLMNRQGPISVQLDPPVRPRTALTLETAALAEDLTVLLGYEVKGE
jgi:hypothetical protein